MAQDLRRLWRLINAFGKVRQGMLQKKMLKEYEQSRYVYENKQISDKMPYEKSDIYVEPAQVLQKTAAC